MSPTRHVTRAFTGKLFQVDVLRWTDASGRRVRREVVRHPGAVLIVPVLDDDRLLMIRNDRVAVDETLWELPAGKLEPGERPADAARRELEEETGHAAARVRPLGTFYTSPGMSDELMHVFLAQELRPVGQRLEPGEQIDVQTLQRREVQAMVAEGRICDGKTIAGLFLWLGSRREQPR